MKVYYSYSSITELHYNQLEHSMSRKLVVIEYSACCCSFLSAFSKSSRIIVLKQAPATHSVVIRKYIDRTGSLQEGVYLSREVVFFKIDPALVTPQLREQPEEFYQIFRHYEREPQDPSPRRVPPLHPILSSIVVST